MASDTYDDDVRDEVVRERLRKALRENVPTLHEREIERVAEAIYKELVDMVDEFDSEIL